MSIRREWGLSTGWLHKEEATEEKTERLIQKVALKGFQRNKRSVSTTSCERDSAVQGVTPPSARGRRGETHGSTVTAGGTRDAASAAPKACKSAGRPGTGVAGRWQARYVSTDTRQPVYLGGVGATRWQHVKPSTQGAKACVSITPISFTPNITSTCTHAWPSSDWEELTKGHTERCLGKNIFSPALCLGTSDKCIDCQSTLSYHNRHQITEHVAKWSRSYLKNDMLHIDTSILVS